MEKKTGQTDDIYKLNEQAGYLLRLAQQRHAVIFQKNTIENLTPMQFSALIRIAEYGEVSQNHLGRLSGMDVATVKGVVERLKMKELVELNADPNDKRRLNISLSIRGQELLPQLHEVGSKITEQTLEPLSDAQKATLVKLLNKIS